MFTVITYDEQYDEHGTELYSGGSVEDANKHGDVRGWTDWEETAEDGTVIDSGATITPANHAETARMVAAAKRATKA